MINGFKAYYFYLRRKRILAVLTLARDRLKRGNKVDIAAVEEIEKLLKEIEE